MYFLILLICRLGYFQLENAALTQDALVDRITKHYIQQVEYILLALLYMLMVHHACMRECLYFRLYCRLCCKYTRSS